MGWMAHLIWDQAFKFCDANNDGNQEDVDDIGNDDNDNDNVDDFS